jgi:hypothetical protein
MSQTSTIIENIQGVYYYTTIITYACGKSVKRIYNTKGMLVDSIPLKNMVNSK